MKIKIETEAEYDEINAYCDWLVDNHNLDTGSLSGLFHILADSMYDYELIHYPYLEDINEPVE